MEYENGHIMEPGTEVLSAYIKGYASEEECRQVDAWIGESDENKKTLKQIAGIYYAQHTKERILERDSVAAFEDVGKKLNKRVVRRWALHFSTAAACILAGVLLSSVYWLWKAEPVSLESRIITVCSNPGMRTSFDLPDGTVAYLNSGSSLSYPLPYGKEKREVTLNGEAYFKVKHDPSHPFVVSVADDRLQVKVLGTEFNLQAYAGEDEIETTLVTGRVVLDMKGKNGTVTEQTLSPSEKAIFDLKAARLKIEKVNTQYETAWIDGKLMFKDCLLPKVLKDLSSFYNVQFKVEDPVIETYSFTGTFQDKQLFQVLDYLKISSMIDYEMSSAANDDSSGVQRTVITLRNEKSN